MYWLLFCSGIGWASLLYPFSKSLIKLCSIDSFEPVQVKWSISLCASKMRPVSYDYGFGLQLLLFLLLLSVSVSLIFYLAFVNFISVCMLAVNVWIFFYFFGKWIACYVPSSANISSGAHDTSYAGICKFPFVPFWHNVILSRIYHVSIHGYSSIEKLYDAAGIRKCPYLSGGVL